MGDRRRVDVLGVLVDPLDVASAVDRIAGWIERGEHHYVCVTGVHGVMESQDDPELLAIHNASGMTTTDGMPLVWASRWAGVPAERVYGPDLMLATLEGGLERKWRSFLYGGAEGVAEALAEQLRQRIPGVDIVGTWCPPFRPLTEAEDAEVVAAINASGADIVWVGLSTPKQERWMAAHVGRVDAAALVGVGAAFDFHAGMVRQAPRWVQRSGFEWLFRLTQDPKRLWRRYVRNNPRFVVRVLRRRPRQA